MCAGEHHWDDRQSSLQCNMNKTLQQKVSQSCAWSVLFQEQLFLKAQKANILAVVVTCNCYIADWLPSWTEEAAPISIEFLREKWLGTSCSSWLHGLPELKNKERIKKHHTIKAWKEQFIVQEWVQPLSVIQWRRQGSTDRFGDGLRAHKAGRKVDTKWSENKKKPSDKRFKKKLRGVLLLLSESASCWIDLFLCYANGASWCQPHYKKYVDWRAVIADVYSPCLGELRAFNLYWIPQNPHLQELKHRRTLGK